MTDGISKAIEELAAAGRLSSTSVLVTSHHWPAHAPRLARLRDRLAIGLHFNLTLGEPLGAMPRLAPSGRFPSLRKLLDLAVSRRLNEAEIGAEVGRQLDRFEQVLGHPPDIIDGHQHVHALPQIRNALLKTLSDRYPNTKPMIRDPADTPSAILARRASTIKALGLSVLAAGFGARARELGFPTNHGFSGASPFSEKTPYATELEHFFRHPGSCHLIMCHPGFPDAELASLDPVVERRRAEFETLRDMPGLPQRIAHPRRDRTGRMTWSNGHDAG